MLAYWDTSAVAALIYPEAHSPLAKEANSLTTRSFAWRWMRVEIECALTRRGCAADQRDRLEAWLSVFTWLDLAPVEHPGLVELNRRHRLRAAYAGHLFVFRRTAEIVGDLTLVSFDAELLAAARAERLRVWSPRGAAATK
jgi:predicted nucleic acid-binding protein